jgi:threonine-phosphate decarboxylase
LNLPLHGSNPKYLFQSLGLEVPDSFIDFSANINPLGPPQSIKEGWSKAFHLISEYPDPRAFQLTALIAEKEGIPENYILAGNGGAELITLIGRYLSSKNVLIIQPAFSEYEQACKASGCHISHHILEEGNWELNIESHNKNMDGMDALFLCNPNNPTGQSFAVQSVLQLLDDCKERNCLVILDEAFHDFLTDQHSYVSDLHDYSNLIILRSLTKMYSIPGLRLGYAMAHPQMIKDLAAFQPHWSVNSLAMMAGEECLKADSFVKETLDYIKNERIKLKCFFEENGFLSSASKINFYLLKDPAHSDQLPLMMYLLKCGIVPRHTYNFPGLEGRWLRFAIKSSDENARLMEVLLKWRIDN